MWSILLPIVVGSCSCKTLQTHENQQRPDRYGRHIRDIRSPSILTTPELRNSSSTLNYTSLEPVNNTTLSVTAHPKKPHKWLVFVSSVPTILILIVCVIVIAIKNYYDDHHVEPEEKDEKDAPGLLELAKKASAKSKRKSTKRKLNQEVYDAMLAKFKADKNKKRSFVGRRSSQIRIEGMASRSPKSLARKHIIIGKLNQEDLAPDGNASALGQLVQLSTHTFIGSKLIEEMEEESEWENDKSHIKSIIENSREDLSEARRILPDDVNTALLPEDLEEAFRNFGNWEESLI